MNVRLSRLDRRSSRPSPRSRCVAVVRAVAEGFSGYSPNLQRLGSECTEPSEPCIALGGVVEFRKVTMIVRASALQRVEEALRHVGVAGVTVSRVKGYGEYRNFFLRDSMTEHVRLEIFTHRLRVDAIVDATCHAASTGGKGDGIIAVLPVESIFRIRDHAKADPNDPDQL